MTKKERNIPNVFIIGLMKTGTTAFYYYFKKHPQIFVPNVREPSYLAKTLFLEKVKNHPKGYKKAHYDLTEDKYLDLYKDANEEILIDMSPIYLYSKEAAQNIYNLNPNGKIILFLRDPVKWLHSLHACNVFDLQEKEKDFKKAIELEKERKERKDNRFLYYGDRTDYAKGLERYLKIFPRDQIKVMFYEDRLKDPDAYLKEILEFMGVKYLPDLKVDVVNVNKEARFGGIIKSFFRIPFIYTFITKLLPNKRDTFLNPLYELIAYKKTERKKIDTEYEKELRKRYRGNVKKLEIFLKDNDFINNDFDLLEFWNYN